MNTAAINMNRYANRERRVQNVSLMEKVRGYFRENAGLILSGLAFRSGSVSIYNLYRAER